jgi:hypothetical protein
MNTTKAWNEKKDFCFLFFFTSRVPVIDEDTNNMNTAKTMFVLIYNFLLFVVFLNYFKCFSYHGL